MTKRLFTLLLTAILVLCLLPACNESRVIDAAEAQKIALAHLGVTADQVSDVHMHLIEQGKIPCFDLIITVGDKEYEYIISPEGQILSTQTYAAGESGHSH